VDRRKDEFLAMLGHELRNPLAPLLSSLELLNADPLKSDDTRLAASDMTLHVRTMRHLLDDLLDISRISRGKFSLQKEHIELHAVVDQSVRVVSGIIKERTHELVVSLPDRAILLEADPVRLEQIIVNLLNNAAKYTPSGGRILLSVETLRARGAYQREGQRHRHRPCRTAPLSSSPSFSSRRISRKRRASASAFRSRRTSSTCTAGLST